MSKRQEFSNVTLSSNAKYKDITAVEFSPMRKVRLDKVREAGSTRYWKWLGLIPVFKIKAKEDLYECHELFWDDRKVTFDELKWNVENCHRGKYMMFRGEVYRKAEVFEKHLSSSNIEYEFKSNEDAMNKMNIIKKYCEECGNTLR